MIPEALREGSGRRTRGQHRLNDAPPVLNAVEFMALISEASPEGL
jgi:hypothetical protein